MDSQKFAEKQKETMIADFVVGGASKRNLRLKVNFPVWALPIWFEYHVLRECLYICLRSQRFILPQEP